MEKRETVRIISGPLEGEVFRYLGPTITDGDRNVSGNQPIDLETQNYHDQTVWRRVRTASDGERAARVEDERAEIQAYISGSSIFATGDLTADAISSQIVDARVLAGSVALSGGAQTSAAVSAGGVFAQNKINQDVKAYVDGDGADGIEADSASLIADNTARISSIAGAATVAGGFSGTTGVSVLIGLSVALNEVDGNVEAYVANADNGLETTTGSVIVTASSQADEPIVVSPAELNGVGLTYDELNDAAKADQDDPDTQNDEADEDRQGDSVILGRIRQLFANKDLPLAMTQVVLDNLRVTRLDDGDGWLVSSPDGTTYVLDQTTGGGLEIRRSTIHSISAAASLSAGIGGNIGVAVSGAGAVSQNVVLTATNAHIDGSKVTSAGNVDLDATSTSEITSIVGAASLGVGGGGATGVGVSIGVAVARSFVGYTPDGDEPRAEVQAYIENSRVTATGQLTQDALADQGVFSVVVSGSMAIGAAGNVGVGVSGSGVFAENRVGVDVKAYVDGDGLDPDDRGITAQGILLSADDTSTIFAFAGAASLAGAFGGTAGVAVSVGVSLARNTVSNDVEASIQNAAGGATATAGSITLDADELASIKAFSAAASLAAGFSGTVGIGVQRRRSRIDQRDPDQDQRLCQRQRSDQLRKCQHHDDQRCRHRRLDLQRIVFRHRRRRGGRRGLDRCGRDPQHHRVEHRRDAGARLHDA